MRARNQVVAKTLHLLACAAAVAAAGCVAERYRPAATASMDATNPCEELVEIHHVTPFYPDRALARSEEGWVKLKYHVAPNGEVFNVRVVASSPQGMFDDASAAAMQRWRYAPNPYPAQNCSHVDVYRFDGGPVVLSPRDQAEFAEFTVHEEPARPASRRSSRRR